MVKKVFVIIIGFVQTSLVFGQQQDVLVRDSISPYFKEIRQATKQAAGLWNRDLYSAMLFVDPTTKTLYANQADNRNSLKPQGDMYIGRLPDSLNVANTSVQWSGKTWAMIMLPLPKDKHDRINLLAHELFHTVQSSLGFTQYNDESIHLDQIKGRTTLRLELEALRKALFSSTQKEQKRHLTNALTFRKYRYAVFETASDTENKLELNEGLAEYTGFMISHRNKEQAKQHFNNSISDFLKNPTYVRSFAYNTTPIYGYLLSLKDQHWNQKITLKHNLTDYFIEHLKITIPVNVATAVDQHLEEYNGKLILEEEKAREEKIKLKIAAYKSKFIETPHFELRFEKMNVSFDPRNILPIEDKVTVYPNIRVTDNWGILEVKKDALMHPNWDKIAVSSPTQIGEQLITGDGWTLQLSQNYMLTKDPKSNNYILVKK